MKNMFKNILILLGCIIIFIAGLALVLMIAPGVKFFDVRYIRAQNGKYERTVKESDYESLTDIVVNGKSVPINIEFVQTQNVLITLNQHFVGFNRSSIEEPELIVSSASNVMTITTHEFEKFGYGKDIGDSTGLTIKIPIYYAGNINVTANKSDVTFSGIVTTLSNLSVKTENSISFTSGLTVENIYISNGNKHITLNKGIQILGNVTVETTGSNLTIENKVGKNITFKSRTGVLDFVGCGNDLTVHTEYGKVIGENAIIDGNATVATGSNISILSVLGNIEATTTSGKVTLGSYDKTGVLGAANIVTGSGDVVLAGVFGTEKISITTTSGDIDVESVHLLSINNKRGKTNITAVNEGYIINGSGDIKINRVLTYLEIESKGGDVILSSENGGTIANTKITTTKGDVTVYNPIGEKYDINSNRGKINFYANKDYTSRLTITAKRSKVNATNISGATDITTNAQVNISLAGINGPININSKDGKVNATILSEFEIYYNLNSTKKNIAAAPGMTTKTHTYSNTKDGAQDKTLTISTRWGLITIV